MHDPLINFGMGDKTAMFTTFYARSTLACLFINHQLYANIGHIHN